MFSFTEPLVKRTVTMKGIPPFHQFILFLEAILFKTCEHLCEFFFCLEASFCCHNKPPVLSVIKVLKYWPVNVLYMCCQLSHSMFPKDC